MIVVGTTWVVVKDCVTRTVDTDVDADRVSVETEVAPGTTIVLCTVVPGNVKVDSKVVVRVLAGS